MAFNKSKNRTVTVEFENQIDGKFRFELKRFLHKDLAELRQEYFTKSEEERVKLSNELNVKTMAMQLAKVPSTVDENGVETPFEDFPTGKPLDEAAQEYFSDPEVRDLLNAALDTYWEAVLPSRYFRKS